MILIIRGRSAPQRTVLGVLLLLFGLLAAATATATSTATTAVASSTSSTNSNNNAVLLRRHPSWMSPAERAVLTGRTTYARPVPDVADTRTIATALARESLANETAHARLQSGGAATPVDCQHVYVISGGPFSAVGGCTLATPCSLFAAFGLSSLGGTCAASLRILMLPGTFGNINTDCAVQFYGVSLTILPAPLVINNTRIGNGSVYWQCYGSQGIFSNLALTCDDRDPTAAASLTHLEISNITFGNASIAVLGAASATSIRVTYSSWLSSYAYFALLDSDVLPTLRLHLVVSYCMFAGGTYLFNSGLIFDYNAFEIQMGNGHDLKVQHIRFDASTLMSVGYDMSDQFSWAISNCHFLNSKISSGFGAAFVYYNSFDGSFLLSQSAFRDNFAGSASGGAGLCFVSQMGNAAVLQLSTVQFLNNRATGTGSSGGALSLYVEMMNGEISFTNVSFTNSYTASTGGAVFIQISIPQIGTVAFHGCTFVGNSAQSGGALSLGTATSTTMDGCVFNSNSAVVEGGAIMLDASAALAISASSFTTNTATSGGGLASQDSTVINITGCTFTDNKGFNGGALYHTGASIATLLHPVFSKNIAYLQGGGLMLREQSVVLCVSCRFMSNNALSSGGAVASQDRGAFTLTSGYIGGNSAVNGGGMYCLGATMTLVSDTVIERNSAYLQGGGVLLQEQANFQCDRCSYVANTASSGGGVATLDSSRFFDRYGKLLSCEATSGSGGALIANDVSRISFSHTRLSGNNATQIGGGVNFVAQLFEAHNTTFDNNYAGLNGGGAVFNSTTVPNLFASSQVILSAVNFTGNTAGQSGGGLFVEGEIRFAMSDTRVVYNRALLGGGMFLLSDLTPTLISVVLSNTEFGWNCACGGGGLYVRGNNGNTTSTVYTNQGGLLFIGNNVSLTPVPPNTAYDATKSRSGRAAAARRGSTVTRRGVGSAVGLTPISDGSECPDDYQLYLSGGGIYFDDSFPAEWPFEDHALYDFENNSAAGYGPDISTEEAQLTFFIGNSSALYPGSPTTVFVHVLDHYGQSLNALFGYDIQLSTNCSIPTTLVSTTSHGIAQFAFQQEGTIGLPCTLCASPLLTGAPPIVPTSCIEYVPGLCPRGRGLSEEGICQICPDGYYSLTDNSEPCIGPCPENVLCYAGMEPVAAENYWLDEIDENTLVAYACPPDYCPAGKSGPPCADNRDEEVPLCGGCLPGFSQWNDNCIDCSKTNHGLIISAIVVSLIYVAVQHCLTQHAFGVFFIFFFFVQICAFVMYPESLSRPVSYMSSRLLELTIGDKCPFYREPWQELFMEWFTPIFTFIQLGVLYVVHRLVLTHTRCCAHYRLALEPEQLDAELKVALSRGYCSYLEYQWTRFRDFLVRRFNSYGRSGAYRRSALGFLITTYEPLLEVTAEFFSCLPIMESGSSTASYSVLSKIPEIRCDSDTWRGLLILFVPSLVYVLGLPPFLFWRLWRHHTGRDNRHKPIGGFSGMPGADPTAMPPPHVLAAHAARPHSTDPEHIHGSAEDSHGAAEVAYQASSLLRSPLRHASKFSKPKGSKSKSSSAAEHRRASLISSMESPLRQSGIADDDADDDDEARTRAAKIRAAGNGDGGDGALPPIIDSKGNEHTSYPQAANNNHPPAPPSSVASAAAPISNDPFAGGDSSSDPSNPFATGPAPAFDATLAVPKPHGSPTRSQRSADSTATGYDDPAEQGSNSMGGLFDLDGGRDGDDTKFMLVEHHYVDPHHLDPNAGWEELMIYMLCHHFRPSYYFGEIWSMTRRMILSLIYVLLTTRGLNFYYQRLSYFLALMFFLLFHLWTHPFHRNRDNHLEALSLSTLVLGAGALASQPFFFENGSQTGPLHIVVLATASVTAALIAGLLVHGQIRKKAAPLPVPPPPIPSAPPLPAAGAGANGTSGGSHATGPHSTASEITAAAAARAAAATAAAAAAAAASGGSVAVHDDPTYFPSSPSFAPDSPSFMLDRSPSLPPRVLDGPPGGIGGIGGALSSGRTTTITTRRVVPKLKPAPKSKLPGAKQREKQKKQSASAATSAGGAPNDRTPLFASTARATPAHHIILPIPEGTSDGASNSTATAAPASGAVVATASMPILTTPSAASRPPTDYSLLQTPAPLPSSLSSSTHMALDDFRAGPTLGGGGGGVPSAMGGVCRGIAAMEKLPEPAVKRVYKIRSCIKFVFGVLSVITIVLLPKEDHAIFLPLEVAICALTFLAAFLCLTVGYLCTTFWACACFIVFTIRCALYSVVAGWEIQNGLIDGAFAWIALLAQVGYSAVYIAFTYVGWKRIQVLRAADGQQPATTAGGRARVTIAKGAQNGAYARLDGAPANGGNGVAPPPAYDQMLAASASQAPPATGYVNPPVIVDINPAAGGAVGASAQV